MDISYDDAMNIWGYFSEGGTIIPYTIQLLPHNIFAAWLHQSEGPMHRTSVGTQCMFEELGYLLIHQ
jgi:hypothetical protein